MIGLTIVVLYLILSMGIFILMYRDIKVEGKEDVDIRIVKSEVNDAIVISIFWPLLFLLSPLDFISEIIDYVSNKIAEYKVKNEKV